MPEHQGDREHLREAIALARRCPPSSTFRVGAVITGAGGDVLSTGYSGETDAHDHAEEVAIGKLAGRDLSGATIYSSLEPCSQRTSRPVNCAGLIVDAGIARVVFAWREPAVFVEGQGAELLRAAGLEVVEINELAHLARAANAHLPGVQA